MYIYRPKRIKSGTRKIRGKIKKERRKIGTRRGRMIGIVRERRIKGKIVQERMKRLKMWILWKVMDTEMTKGGKRTKIRNIGSGIRAQLMM